jgi:hypothetical protein
MDAGWIWADAVLTDAPVFSEEPVVGLAYDTGRRRPFMFQRFATGGLVEPAGRDS